MGLEKVNILCRSPSPSLTVGPRACSTAKLTTGSLSGGCANVRWLYWRPTCPTWVGREPSLFQVLSDADDCAECICSLCGATHGSACIPATGPYWDCAASYLSAPAKCTAFVTVKFLGAASCIWNWESNSIGPIPARDSKCQHCSNRHNRSMVFSRFVYAASLERLIDFLPGQTPDPQARQFLILPRQS